MYKLIYRTVWSVLEVYTGYVTSRLDLDSILHFHSAACYQALPSTRARPSTVTYPLLPFHCLRLFYFIYIANSLSFLYPYMIALSKMFYYTSSTALSEVVLLYPQRQRYYPPQCYHRQFYIYMIRGNSTSSNAIRDITPRDYALT